MVECLQFQDFDWTCVGFHNTTQTYALYERQRQQGMTHDTAIRHILYA